MVRAERQVAAQSSHPSHSGQGKSGQSLHSLLNMVGGGTLLPDYLFLRTETVQGIISIPASIPSRRQKDLSEVKIINLTEIVRVRVACFASIKPPKVSSLNE